MKKLALGKGLNALIPTSYKEQKIVEQQKQAVTDEKTKESGLCELPISSVRPNAEQPRQYFEEEKIEELCQSIREKGILQPIIVKKLSLEGTYEIICGERRWRAAQKAGYKVIPAIVKDVAQETLLELALIENIQREDLNPIEEAEAYQRLQDRGISHDDIAKKVGKNRTTIVNTLRLLRLPKDILRLVVESRLSEGHARALLGLPTEEYQTRLAKRIIEEDLSVRQVEELVRAKGFAARPAKRVRKIDAQISDLERKMELKLGSKVRLFAGKNKGKIEIRYYSLDELDAILSVLGVSLD